MNIDKFNQQQIDFAARVGDAAVKAGVNPDFAIMILYGETGFNPSAFSDDPAQLTEDIDVYVNYLRDLATRYQDPDKVAAAYLEGEGSKFLASGNPEDLEETTRGRLQNIFELGRFPDSMLMEQEKTEAAAPQEAAAPDTSAEDARIAGERRAAQGIGAGAGSLLAARNLIKDVRRGGFPPPKTPPRTPAAGPAGPRPGPVAQPAAIPGMRPDISMPGDPNVERILQGTTEEGATGRARQTGYNTETAQQAARTNQAKQTLGALQRQGVIAPGKDLFAAQPGMTSTPSGVLFPRSEPPRTLGPRGPAGEIGPTKPPAPPPPPRPGGLERVTQMFTRIAETPAVQSLGKGISRYGGPPAAGYTAFGEGTTAQEEFSRGNYPSAAASGLSVLGSGLMLNPGTMLPGGALSLAGPTYRLFEEGGVKPPPPLLPKEQFEELLRGRLGRE